PDKQDHAPAEWEILGDEHHADCRVFEVVKRHCRHPVREREATFFIIKAMNWAVAIAETQPGRYVLVNQFRYGSKSLSWEFPAGCLDGDESPLEAGVRELR